MQGAKIKNVWCYLMMGKPEWKKRIRGTGHNNKTELK